MLIHIFLCKNEIKLIFACIYQENLLSLHPKTKQLRTELIKKQYGINIIKRKGFCLYAKSNYTENW